MGRIVVVGAGLAGLGAAMLLAGDGDQVIVLERDPARPPSDPAEAWERWQRPGLNQFQMAHAFLAGFRSVLDAELPDVSKALQDAGGLRLNLIRDMPAAMTGGWRDGDEGYEWLTGRRPVFARPGLRDKTLQLGSGWREQQPLGPTREQLLALATAS